MIHLLYPSSKRSNSKFQCNISVLCVNCYLWHKREWSILKRPHPSWLAREERFGDSLKRLPKVTWQLQAFVSISLGFILHGDRDEFREKMQHIKSRWDEIQETFRFCCLISLFLLICALQGDLRPEIQFGFPGTAPKSFDSLFGSPVTAAFSN